MPESPSLLTRRIKIEEKAFKIWISLIKNIGIKKYQDLIQTFGSKKDLWNATKYDLLKVSGIGEKLSETISNSKIKRDIDRHLKYMESHNIDIIAFEDKEYPLYLKEIDNPPLNIYIIGRKNILNNSSIAIVGSRDCTEYGKVVAKDFGFSLSKNGFNIVSGLARGIDLNSHIGALKAKGLTVAVLGNGLDTIYPKENTRIAEEIINSGGAIISEYPLGTKIERMNFPARNRIISGLCNGVLVVEAKPKSGTMITVDFALDQGRDVFVIPGNIDSVSSMGTNELIRQGAKLVTNPEEIIEEYLNNRNSFINK